MIPEDQLRTIIQKEGKAYLDSNSKKVDAAKLSDHLLKKLREVIEDRKIVVHVTTIQQEGQGCNSGSRCFWNEETDSAITENIITEDFIHIINAYCVLRDPFLDSSDDDEDYERACNALELSSLLDPLFIQCLKNKNSPFILPLVQRLLYILRSELKVLETLLNENEHIAIKILHEIKDLAILSRENDVFKLCLEIFNTYAQNAPNLMVKFIQNSRKLTTHLGKYSSELRGNDALFQIINSNYIREVHASVLIQKYWRGYSYKKRYNVMLRGFMALQRLFMMKRSAKELAKWTKLFEKSDTCFLKGYQSLVGRRLCHEGRYSYISTLSPKKFRDYQIGEQGRAATQIQNFWKEVKHKKINLEFEETRKRDSAARTIQKYACKWLLCKQKKYQWSKTLFSPTDLSKDKIKSIQDEINFFQKTLGSKVIEKENFIEKYNESQWRFAKFQLSLNRSRLSEHRISARLAQSITICELISNPPGLDVYDPERDWKNFHTLSLPAATASRIEHKATIEDFEAPKWKDAVNKCIEQYYDLP